MTVKRTRRRAVARRIASLAAALLVMTQLAFAQPSSSVALNSDKLCSANKTMPGGEWPTYGRDLANTRAQVAETALGPLQAATLAPRWVFDTGHTSDVLGMVDINSTPVVARGCVYVGDAGGDIVALRADTGELAWRSHIELLPPGSGARAGTVVGSVAVDGSRVIAVVNQLDGPYAVALDARTGAALWRSPAVDTQPDAYSHASPIVFGGTVFVGFSGPEGIVTGQGGFALLDATDGHLLKKTYTIPEPDQAVGYGGGGIWSTPAVDEGTHYGYVGTGNPFSKQVEHPRTNAILKIDLDRSRPTFGSIVASYKGDIDQYEEVLRSVSEPTCAVAPENPTLPIPFPPFLPPIQEARDSLTCLQMDLDFGAAPNLLTSPDGTMLVGELQKSGVYHVIRGDTMARERRIALGLSCLVCNGASTAYDAVSKTAFADVSPGTAVTAFSALEGTRRWTAPVADAIHYQPLALADGVVYTVDSLGFLDGYDAVTGLPVLHRSLLADGAIDAVAALASSGIAVANHTVYVAAGSRILAYRPAALSLGL